MIKYKAACYFRPIIEVVEVLRETERQIVLAGQLGRRVAKRSDYESYFDTWEEARDFLIDRSRLKISSLKKSLDDYEQGLAKINAMQPPEVTR